MELIQIIRILMELLIHSPIIYIITSLTNKIHITQIQQTSILITIRSLKEAHSLITFTLMVQEHPKDLHQQQTY